LPREGPLPLLPLRTDTEGPLPLPVMACESRPDTDRFDAWEVDLDEREERLDDERPESPPERAEGTGAAAGAGGTGGAAGAGGRPLPDPAAVCAAAGSGARPQVSQYSSPPPTSSTVPSHPGRWHLLTVSPSTFP